MSWLRLILAAALVAAAVAAPSTRPEAQTLPYGSIGLYVDENRSSNTMTYAGAITEFTMYVFCRGGSQGMAAVEFAVAYPANVIPGGVTTSPLVSVELGDLASGMSAAFSSCQVEWFWSHHQQLYLTSGEETRIEIGEHPVVGALQEATCEPGYPLEPLAISSSICLNSTCPVDVTPPILLAATNVSMNCVEIGFSEAVIEQTAEDPLNYEIAEADSPAVVLSISEAILQAGGATARLYTSASLIENRMYVVRAHDVLDPYGNAVPPSSELAFTALDRVAPRLLSAEAPNDRYLTVYFNEGVDPATAEAPGNYRVYYSIDPENPENDAPCCSPSSATVIAEGAVRLSFYFSPMPMKIALILRVANVTDLAGNVISPYYRTARFIVPDPYPPAIDFVQMPDTNLLDVRFSEAISDSTAGVAGHYEVYEKLDTLSTVPVSGAVLLNAYTARLTLGAPLELNTIYVLRVRGVRDTSGNLIAAPGTIEFTPSEYFPPVPISATALSHTLIRIVFNKQVEETSAETVLYYRVFETTNEAATIPVGSATLEAGGDAVRLGLDAWMPFTPSFTVNIIGVRDLGGRAIASTSLVVSVADTVPPQIQSVYQESFTLLYVWFDEATEAQSAGNPANYSLVGVTPPTAAIAPSAVTRLADRIVSLSFSPAFTPGRIYALQVSNVADLAGNVIAPGSEKRFVASPSAGGGSIGLYVDMDRSESNVDYTGGDTEFEMYVWCKPGTYGAAGAEFYIPWTGNVYPGAVTVNASVVSSSSGEPFGGMSATFSQCATDWVWICRETCYLIDSEESTLDINVDPNGTLPTFITCAEQNPIEIANVISPITCNWIRIATLLAGFTASYDDGSIDLAWSLSRRDEEVRFAVSRAKDGTDEYTALADEISGGDLSFSYRDRTVEPGTSYRYRVAYVDGAGAHVLFDTEPVAVPAIPLTLYQNWPNPFNPATTVEYYLPAAAAVRLEIFDVAGHRIRCLVNARQDKGKYSAAWNGADESGRAVAAGIYIYRLSADKATFSRKMILLR